MSFAMSRTVATSPAAMTREYSRSIWSDDREFEKDDTAALAFRVELGGRHPSDDGGTILGRSPEEITRASYLSELNLKLLNRKTYLYFAMIYRGYAAPWPLSGTRSLSREARSLPLRQNHCHRLVLFVLRYRERRPALPSHSLRSLFHARDSAQSFHR
jgi:hypothetical protein